MIKNTHTNESFEENVSNGYKLERSGNATMKKFPALRNTTLTTMLYIKAKAEHKTKTKFKN